MENAPETSENKVEFGDGLANGTLVLFSIIFWVCLIGLFWSWREFPGALVHFLEAGMIGLTLSLIFNFISPEYRRDFSLYEGAFFMMLTVFLVIASIHYWFVEPILPGKWHGELHKPGTKFHEAKVTVTFDANHTFQLVQDRTDGSKMGGEGEWATIDGGRLVELNFPVEKAATFRFRFVGTFLEGTSESSKIRLEKTGWNQNWFAMLGEWRAKRQIEKETRLQDFNLKAPDVAGEPTKGKTVNQPPKKKIRNFELK